MNEKLKAYEEKMTKTMGNLDGELGAIRAGRANPNVLNKIMVDYYGTPTPIQQVANVSVPEAAYDPDPAMGEVDGKSNRKSDHDF